jgi:hypothetical protein
MKGVIGQSNRLLTLLLRTANQSGEGLSMAEDPAHAEYAPGAAEEFHKNWVEPAVENQARFELGPDATLSDKIFHGLGSTGMMIIQAIASGGAAAGGAATEALGGGFAARAAGGAIGVTLPATANAVDIGKQVLKETGDMHAAQVAGLVSYLVNAGAAAVPMGVGRSFLTRVPTAGATGAALGYAQRKVQNAVLPENMQQPETPGDALVDFLTTAPFGLGAHGGGVRRSTKITGANRDVLTEAQRVAMQNTPGDALDKVGAAANAHAELTAHHDNAAVEALRQQELNTHNETMAHLDQQIAEEEAGQLQEAMGARREAAGQGMENEEADIQQGVREQNINAAEEAATTKAGGPPPDADTAFAQRRAQVQAEEQAARDRDFAPARNQAGDQAIDQAEGVARGGANEAGPTLADLLPPEQRAALERLKVERAGAPPPEANREAIRAAQAGRENEEADRLTAQRQAQEASRARLEAATPPKGGLPPVEAPETLQERRLAAAAAEQGGTPPKAAALRRAAQMQKQTDEETVERLPPQKAPRQAAAPREEEEAPEGNPPPQTAQTLAERRQAELDRQMAAKVRETPAASEKAPAHENVELEPQDTRALADYDRQGVNRVAPEPAKPNRLAAIREAAQKNPQNQLPSAAQEIIDELRAGRKPVRPAVANNASGESPASQEAVNRVEQERAAGVQRFSVDPDGNRTPLTGVDAVDARAPKGGLVIQRDAQGNETILDRGGQNKLQANGLLQRSKLRPSTAPEEAPPRRTAAKAAADMTMQDFHNAEETGVEEPRGPGAQVQDTGSIFGRRQAKTVEATHEAAGPSSEEREQLSDMHRAAAEADGRPTKESATEHLQSKLDRLGDTAKHVVVHDNFFSDDVPKEWHQDLAGQGYDTSRGFSGIYDPNTDTVHIFANHHLDHASLDTTLAHELGHLGVWRATGGDNAEYARTMGGILKTNTAARQWAANYARDNKLDVRDPAIARDVANEYAAHLAEAPWRDPTVLQRIYQAVRNAFRKIGLVKYWTDDDIRDLILRGDRNQAGLRSAKAAGERMPLRPQTVDADNLKRLEQAFPEDHPNAIGARFAATKEAMAAYAPSFPGRVKDFMENMGYKTIPKMLATIDLRHLPDFVDKRNMPSIRKFIEQNDLRRGRQGTFQQAADARLREWSKWADKNPEENATLETLMHGSTIAGTDPSKDYAPRYSAEDQAADPKKAAWEQSRANLHTRMQGMYDGMSEQGRQLYNNVRDDYIAHRNATWNALEARINETGASDQDKKRTLATLRRAFEAGTVQGPYFPLFRTGDLWARSIDADGNHVAFSRFESAGERRAWMKSQSDQGLRIEAGKKDTTDKSLMERIDPDFVRQVMEVTKDTPAVQDEIWQTYLRAMPEMSMRKQFIHRQGRLGFSGDAQRAYAFHMQHGAMQIARLEYGNRLDTIAAQAKKEADAIQQSDPGTWKAEMSSGAASELAKRNQWIKNPQNSAWTNAVNQMGFGWYLGFAPATAFRIHTQNSMLASPILAARYQGKGKFGQSQVRATSALNKAVLQWARAKGNLRDTLRGDELAAFKAADEQGMFTNTWASTLGAAATGTPVTGTRANLMNAAQWLFNAIEHKNRMTTYLAAYRLGRENGLDHAEAVRQATSSTWDAHLDYNNDNRARFLQNDFMKVAGQFKQYPLGVAYRLARDFRDSLPSILKNENLTEAERKVARREFGGLLVRSFLYSGAVGLPMAWAVEAGVNWGMSTPDEPFDSREALHSYLSEEFSPTAADMITYGPMSAITGAALSSGASYSDLLYKTPQRYHEMSAGELTSDAAEQALGPAFGAIMNMANGVSIGTKYGWERGLEHMLPPSVTGPMKAFRLGTQGATTLRGDTVMSPEEMGQGWSQALGIPEEAIREKNLFLQALGLTPQIVSNRYQQNTTIRDIQTRIMDRRSQLEGDYETAVQNGDSDRAADIQQDVNDFNKAHPSFSINLGRSVVQRMKAQQKLTQGVAIKPGLKQELENRYGEQ